jgi:hypothetical protein
MTVWAWFGIGTIALLGLSLFAAIAMAKVLGTISEEVTQLLEEDPWTSAPLMRGIEPSVDDRALVNDQSPKRAGQTPGLRAADKI